MNNNKIIPYRTPLRLLLLSAISLFIAEAAIMTFFHFIFDFPSHLEIVIDASVLTIISLLILYFYLFRPMLIQISDRLRAEESTKLAHAELNQIFQTAADGMRVIDLEFNMLRINETFSVLAGIDKSIAIGKKCYEVFPGPLCHTQYCSLKRILRGEERIEDELIRERMDGSKVPCIVTATPFHSPSGELLGIVEDFKDITERKKSEEVLLASEQKLNAMLQSIGDHMSMLDKDLNIIWANDVAKKIFGNDIIGKKCYQAYHGREKPCEPSSPCLTLKAFHDGRIHEHETSVIDKEGNLRYYHCAANVALRDKQGNPSAVIEISRDITERKKVEEAHRKSEEEKKIILDAMSEALSYRDKDMKILWANRAFVELTGLSYERVKGSYCYDVLCKRDSPCQKCNIHNAVLKTGKSQETEMIMPGERIFFLRGHPVKDPEGNVKGVVMLSADITERKKMEEEHLKVAKLESLGIFAGGLAHDFNNLLTAIIGNINFAKIIANHDEEAFKALTMAEKASFRARDLTLQLLRFSKGGEPVKKVVSITNLIRDSANFILSGSSVKCKFSFAKNLMPVEVDEGQITQVMNNIFINAIQAMPGGGVINVYAENINAGSGNFIPVEKNKYVKISIQDHGIGIPKEFLTKIFDPYFTTKQKGSGLGLSTAYQIVKKHSGYILAESEQGAGTTFHVYLPAHDSPVSFKKEEPEQIARGKGKILVMDDEEILREFTSRLLGRIGYDVTLASKGEEMISMYNEARESGEPFDAILMDLTIPGGMGGKEAIKALLEIDPDVKAIVSSGYSNDPIMSNYKKYGFKGVIEKPYTVHELNRVLSEVISDKSLK